jgi:hypothetical protein
MTVASVAWASMPTRLFLAISVFILCSIFIPPASSACTFTHTSLF